MAKVFQSKIKGLHYTSDFFPRVKKKKVLEKSLNVTLRISTTIISWSKFEVALLQSGFPP
jgi:hypothetical protein